MGVVFGSLLLVFLAVLAGVGMLQHRIRTIIQQGKAISDSYAALQQPPAGAVLETPPKE